MVAETAQIYFEVMVSDVVLEELGRGNKTAAEVDALHIGVAVANGADYLLTWNCRHIANAEMRDKIGAVCRDAGYEPPVICTPEELMGD